MNWYFHNAAFKIHLKKPINYFTERKVFIYDNEFKRKKFLFYVYKNI